MEETLAEAKAMTKPANSRSVRDPHPGPATNASDPQISGTTGQSLVPIVADVEGALSAASVLSSSTELAASSSNK